MRWIAMIGLGLLAACGAEGEPMRPTGGVSMSVGSHGIDTDVRIGATDERVSVALGL